MRILGIDPGTVTVGFGCLDVADLAAGGDVPGARPVAHRAANVVRAVSGSSDSRVVDVGVLRLGRSDTAIEVRLGRLALGLAELIERLRPNQLALECAFAGKSIQAALRIGEARGVILAEAHRASLAVIQLTPARIKRCVTGHGAASKEAVARMTQQLLALPELPKPADATDALAVAYACAEQRFALRHLAR